LSLAPYLLPTEPRRVAAIFLYAVSLTPFTSTRIGIKRGQSMERVFLVAGSVSAFLAVALGAFGAHGLEGRLLPSDLETFEVAARYQMYHALGLLFLGLALERWPGVLGSWAGWAFLAGTVVFSGSLYALVLTGVRVLGAVTPIGGVMLLAGWVLTTMHIIQSR